MWTQKHRSYSLESGNTCKKDFRLKKAGIHGAFFSEKFYRNTGTRVSLILFIWTSTLLFSCVELIQPADFSSESSYKDKTRLTIAYFCNHCLLHIKIKN